MQNISCCKAWHLNICSAMQLRFCSRGSSTTTDKAAVDLIFWSLQTVSSLDLTQSSSSTPRLGGGRQVRLINVLHLMQKEL